MLFADDIIKTKANQDMIVRILETRTNILADIVGFVSLGDYLKKYGKIKFIDGVDYQIQLKRVMRKSRIEQLDTLNELIHIDTWRKSNERYTK